MYAKELLELAAKAVGYEFVKYHIPQQDRTSTLSTTWSDEWAEVKKPEAVLGNCRWNPLLSDADSFRLESKLGLDVQWLEHWVCVGGHSQHFAAHNYDKQSARRHAGVIAAASIGKSIP